MGMSRKEAGSLGYIKAKQKFDELLEKKIREAKEKYEQNKKYCKVCNVAIEYEKRVNNFCSQTCSATYNNKKRSTIKEVKCLNEECNKTFKSYKTSSNKAKQFCNSKCQQEHTKNLIYRQLLAGQNVSIGHDRARNLMIHIYGARCMGGPTDDTKECRWDKINPTSGKCPIELEHIDGDSNNNRLDNLKLLCPSCHSLTPTYKALNKGNGRHSRRIRYNEGKSY